MVRGGAVLDAGVELVGGGGAQRGHQWIPHSVLAVPAQRPLRGSSPGATRRVQGAQPIDG
jgi:hypothetical protein